MEGHVGGLLRPLAALAAAAVGLASVLRALAGDDASVEWSLLGGLAGLLAMVLALPALRPAGSNRRRVLPAALAALLGALVVAAAVGPIVWLVWRAYRDGGAPAGL